MSRFLGGSAYAMATQISEGFILPTPVVLRRFDRAELNQLQFELQKQLTTLRSNQPLPEDIKAVQTYHHKISRVRGALQVIQNQLSMKK